MSAKRFFLLCCHASRKLLSCGISQQEFRRVFDCEVFACKFRRVTGLKLLAPGLPDWQRVFA